MTKQTPPPQDALFCKTCGGTAILMKDKEVGDYYFHQGIENNCRQRVEKKYAKTYFQKTPPKWMSPCDICSAKRSKVFCSDCIGKLIKNSIEQQRHHLKEQVEKLKETFELIALGDNKKPETKWCNLTAVKMHLDQLLGGDE